MSSETREIIRTKNVVSSGSSAAAVSGIRSPSYIQVRLPSLSASALFYLAIHPSFLLSLSSQAHLPATPTPHSIHGNPWECVEMIG